MTTVELPDINQYVSRGKSHQSLQRKQDTLKFQKLATIKSVDKFIKSNDISSVIGKDNNYYPKQLEDQKKFNEINEVHHNLNSLKRSCDDLKRKAQLKEIQIEKMRKEIEQMARADEGFQLTLEEMEKKAKDLEEQFQQNKFKENEAQMTRKTYEHMLSRMKKDSLVYKLRANTSENALNKNLTTLASKSEESQKVNEDLQKAEVALHEVIEGIEHQNYNREQNLQRFKEDLKTKQNIEKKREDRIKRQQEIAEVAANDIRDSNLKKWRKLLLVHKFLNHFLKLKMHREIKKFQGVEQAFQKIKAATGVNDANEIVRKFLGREQTYSHLLISIAEYEKQIDVLKHENDESRQRLQKLKNEFGNVEQQPEELDEDTQEQEKILMEIEAKALSSTLLSTKLEQWIEKNLTKLQRAGLIEEKQNIEGNKEGFNQVVTILRSQLLQLTEEEQILLINQQIKSQKEQVNESDFQRRNVRVKPSLLPKKTLTSFSQERPNSKSRQEDAEMWEQISKIEDQDDQFQEEVNHFKTLREDVKQDGKKKK